jgi:hypothetical protein
MPIEVVCPRCSKRMSVSESVTGTSVRCRGFGCNSLVPVPPLPPADPPKAATAPEPSPRPPARPAAPTPPTPAPVALPPPLPRRAVDADEEEKRPRRRRRYADDDDDYDFDHPRRRRKRGSGSGKAFAVAAIVIGSLAILGAIGYGIYALVSKKSGSDTVKKTAPPGGWKEYTYKKEGFKAYFPSEPLIQDFGSQAIAGESMTMTAYAAKFPGDAAGGIAVVVIRFPNGMLGPRMKELMMAEIRNRMVRGAAGLSSPRPVTWAGYQGEEVTIEESGAAGRGHGEGVLRYIFTDSAAYFALIGSDNGRLKPEVENGFFANFELLK